MDVRQVPWLKRGVVIVGVNEWFVHQDVNVRHRRMQRHSFSGREDLQGVAPWVIKEEVAEHLLASEGEELRQVLCVSSSNRGNVHK